MDRFTSFLSLISSGAEVVTRQIGQRIAWLTGLLAAMTLTVVLLRVLLQWGAISLQESLTYIHALTISLASAYTLAENGHVRVDIFYRGFDPLKKAWVDAIGTVLFLLPFAVFSFCISWHFVLSSWAIREASADAGGIPAIFLLKSLILVNAALLILQAIADLARNVCTLTQKQYD